VDRATLYLTTRFGGRSAVDVEVPQTAVERARGLGGRKVVPPGTGMLFMFDAPGEVDMWMHGMLVPLDIIFFRSDGVVHRIAARRMPGMPGNHRVWSQGRVSAVLELAGGEADRMGLRVGDSVLASGNSFVI
jgi:uncharacterized membrane protein (UPF0127 family)